MKMIYERRADESEGWYERFRLWLLMGSEASLVEVHAYATTLAAGMMQGQSEDALPSDFESWQRAAERFAWRERVIAYEKAMEESVEGGTSDARAEELRMVATLLQQVNNALQRADLFDLTREEARANLSTLRLFFRDLFRLHRDALQLAAASTASAGGGQVVLNADEFIDAINTAGGMQQLMAELHRVTDSTAGEAAWQPLRDLLAQLYHDESSARRIADQAHLDATRIHFAARALDRWHAILIEASHAGYMERVIAVALAEYPHNRDLAEAVSIYRRGLVPKDAQGQKADSGVTQKSGVTHKSSVKHKSSVTPNAGATPKRRATPKQEMAAPQKKGAK